MLVRPDSGGDPHDHGGQCHAPAHQGRIKRRLGEGQRVGEKRETGHAISQRADGLPRHEQAIIFIGKQYPVVAHSPSARRYPAVLRLFHRGQGGINVGNEVVKILNANGNPHQIPGHLQGRTRHGLVRHGGRMLHQRLHPTQ